MKSHGNQEINFFRPGRRLNIFSIFKFQSKCFGEISVMNETEKNVEKALAQILKVDKSLLSRMVVQVRF